VRRTALAGIRWTDFHRLEDCLKAGEDAERGKADEVRSLIRRRKMKKALSFRSCFPSS